MGYSEVHLLLMSSAETLDSVHTALHGPGLLCRVAELFS